MDETKLDKLETVLLGMLDEHDELCAMQEQLAIHGALSADAACILQRIPIYQYFGLVPASEGYALYSTQLKVYAGKLKAARESFLETIANGIEKFWNAILNFFKKLLVSEENMFEVSTAHLKKEIEKHSTSAVDKAMAAGKKEEKGDDTFRGLPKDVREKVEAFVSKYTPASFFGVLKTCNQLNSCKTREDCDSTMLSIAKSLNAAVSGSGRTFEVDAQTMIRVTGDFGVKNEDLELKDVPKVPLTELTKNLNTSKELQKQATSYDGIINNLDNLRTQAENSIKNAAEEVVKLRYRCSISALNAVRGCVLSLYRMKRALLSHYKNTKTVMS